MTQNINPPRSARPSPSLDDAPASSNGLDPQRRRKLADDLVDELTRWPPRERMGTFKAWHRGSLSLVHLSVLAALEARSPLSMSEAAEALDVSIASATGIVDRMEKRQLVRRRHAADDRRVVFIELTDAGGKVFRDLEAQRRVRLGRLVEELNDEELAGFLGGLRALHAARVRLLENGVDPAKGPAAGGRAGSEAEAARP